MPRRDGFVLIAAADHGDKQCAATAAATSSAAVPLVGMVVEEEVVVCASTVLSIEAKAESVTRGEGGRSRLFLALFCLSPFCFPRASQINEM